MVVEAGDSPSPIFLCFRVLHLLPHWWGTATCKGRPAAVEGGLGHRPGTQSHHPHLKRLYPHLPLYISQGPWFHYCPAGKNGGERNHQSDLERQLICSALRKFN